MSVSKTILVGNLGGDPELRAFADGTSVCNFSLATSESWRDKQTGERKNRSEWHKVVIVGKLADIAAQYLRKGSKVYIEGENRTRSYEKDGAKVYVTEVYVGMRGQMQMLDSRSDNTEAPAQRTQQPARRPAPQANAQAGGQPEPNYDSFDDDIPFDNPYRGKRSLLV